MPKITCLERFLILSHVIDDVTDLQITLDDFSISKVDKVEGMGLSTNDFTNEYKTKLDNT